ncbi:MULTISPECIES: porin [Burkholderia]|nr:MULTISPECIES: porin [Burkholderia]NIE83792.1 porin [Burkholderia sp. Tr-860]NIF61433.1 porin [Burkholderia sp. Cy-647]NIF68826.1 porin [Burkholderia sp. Ap-962]NIF87245.1 porin [Burkholderia sp. Cy-637]NIF94443.1 porin [Burkholderia sp. Ax-1720]
MRRCMWRMCAALGLVVSAAAQAQGSVTLYGVMDNGVSFISNEHGHGLVKANDGVFTPNLWGIRGSEDLGNGLKAIFQLTNQFQVNTGNITPGQSLFSKTSIIGLSDDRYGTLTLGSQYDFMATSLWASGIDTADDGGFFFGFPAGPFQKLGIPNNPTGELDWDRSEGTPIANTAKYQSPVIAGLSFGAMYGFGNVAGSVGAGNSSSFGLNYVSGNLGLGAAYTDVKYLVTGSPQVSVRNWGAGAKYEFGKLILHAVLSTVHNMGNGAAAYQMSGGIRWRFAPALMLSGEYMYMKGNGFLDNNHANQVGATLFYILSARTTVYVSSIYQRANAGASAQISGITDPGPGSSSNNQTVLRIGLHTRF